MYGLMKRAEGLMEKNTALMEKRRGIRAAGNKISRLERSVVAGDGKPCSRNAVWQHAKRRGPGGRRRHRQGPMKGFIAGDKMRHACTGRTPERFESLSS